MFAAGMGAQICIGLACGALNLLVSYVVNSLRIPLFLDEFLLIVASFFGWVSGAVCIVSHSVLNIAVRLAAGNHSLSFVMLDALFVLCDVATFLIVRLMFRKSERISVTELLLAGITVAIVISVIGGILFAVLFTLFGYGEIVSVRHLTMLLLHSRFPLAAAAILSRLPVNLLDKMLSVFLGFFIALAIRRTLRLPPPHSDVEVSPRRPASRLPEKW